MDGLSGDWMDAAVRRLIDRGITVNRAVVQNIAADLCEVVADALGRGRTVKLWGIVLRPDGTAEFCSSRKCEGNRLEA